MVCNKASSQALRHFARKACSPELRQLLADAKNDIDRRLPLFTLVKIPRRSKIHRSKIPRMVIFPSTIFNTVTSFRC